MTMTPVRPSTKDRMTHDAAALVARINPSPAFARALMAALADRLDPEAEVYISCKEFARLVGIHHNTVTNWCKAGLIRHQTLPSGRRKIAASEVQRIRSRVSGRGED